MKFLFEGEEEIGSPHLPAFLREHAGELAADLVISADGAMWRPSEPSLALASKGLVSMDIIVEGAGTDLHSGRYGGTVANPLHALSEILASLHHPDGTVAVPGFYDGIPALSPATPARDRRCLVRRNEVPRRTRPGPRRTARPGSARWSASGSGRRWRSTAWRAAGSTP